MLKPYTGGENVPRNSGISFPRRSRQKVAIGRASRPWCWGVTEENDGWSGSGTPSLGNHWAQGGDMPVWIGSSSTVEPELSRL